MTTALLLSAIGLAAVFWLPAPAFAALAAAVLPGLGGWEAARLAGLERPPARMAYAAVLVAACVAAGWAGASADHWLLIAAAVIWLVNFAWLARHAFGRNGGTTMTTLKLVSLAGVLVGAWLALIRLQEISGIHVLLLLVIIAAADVGAFFTGRALGGARLAPVISPGKTRAGALGGLAAAMLLTAAAAAVLPGTPLGWAAAGVLALPLAVASIGGDLFISLLKRQRSLKDTGDLLPGHGGVLDRFDSLCAALPFYALAVVPAAL